MNRTATISTVKAPIKELSMFVNYHINSGIDMVILFLDDPHDTAFSFFLDYSKVHVTLCTDEYWDQSRSCGTRPASIEERQNINVNKGAAIASDYGCEWIIHIDSDELIQATTNLKSELARCKKVDAIKFTVLEAVSERTHYENIFMPIWFKANPTWRRIGLAQKLGCKRAIFEGEYFRGHLASKMAIRVSSKIKKYRIHDAETFCGKLDVDSTDSIKLLHFDCIGIENWITKWHRRLDGTAIAKDMRENRRKQMGLFEAAINKDKEALVHLYGALHKIPLYEKLVLFLLGMLKKISIDPTLFERRQ
jgi:hypothetical protein